MKSAVDKALELIEGGEAGSRVWEVFEPLRLACESRAEKPQAASLDCIAKLIAYGLFVAPTPVAQNATSPLASPASDQTYHARNGSKEGVTGGALVDVAV